MTDTIIAAIIGAAATIAGVLLTKHFTNIKKRTKEIFLMESEEDIAGYLTETKEIFMYTVNSFELCNRINAYFEQTRGCLERIILLVRKKEGESEKNLKNLKDIVGNWGRWVSKGRIRELYIYCYNHDPDHYYTIFDNRLVFTGHIYFDNTKPTDTNIDYTPLVVYNDTDLGNRIISNFKNHFDNLVKMCETECIYSANRYR